MDEPGLDGRHRNLNGRIHQKRSDALNGNLPKPIAGFGPRTTMETMRRVTGQTSEAAIREAARRRLK